MTHPRINKKLREEWKLIFSLSLLLIILATIGELFIMKKKTDEVLVEAEAFLVPLPTTLDWGALEPVNKRLLEAPYPLGEFLQQLDPDRISVGDKKIDEELVPGSSTSDNGGVR